MINQMYIIILMVKGLILNLLKNRLAVKKVRSSYAKWTRMKKVVKSKAAA